MSTFYLDIAAQIFGFVGALLLYYFGLPPKVSTEGAVYRVLEQTDETEKAKGQKYQKIGRYGLIFIVISFALQFVSTLIKN